MGVVEVVGGMGGMGGMRVVGVMCRRSATETGGRAISMHIRFGFASPYVHG